MFVNFIIYYSSFYICCHMRLVKQLWSSAVLLKPHAVMVVSVSFHVTSVKSLSNISIPLSCMFWIIVERVLFLVMIATNLSTTSFTWRDIYAFMLVHDSSYVECVINLSSSVCIEGSFMHTQWRAPFFM